MTEAEIVALVEKTVADAVAKIPSDVKFLETAVAGVYAKIKAAVVAVIGPTAKGAGIVSLGGLGAWLGPLVLKFVGL